MEDVISEPAGFSLFSSDFIGCPFPAYDWMLEEKPIWRDVESGFFVVTRYDDVRAVLMDHQTWSSRTSQIFNRTSTVSDQVQAIYERDGWKPLDTLVSNDPPQHRHYRALVERALTPARIKVIQPIIDRNVDLLVDDMLARGSLDFMKGFAIPLTMAMLSSQITGAGSEDIDKIRLWTEMITEGINPVLAPERELEIAHETVKFQQYVARAIEKVRAQPDGTILNDLVHARIDGQGLSVQEIIAIITLFFGAGHDTTTSALGSAMRHLAEHPLDLAALRAQPDKVATFVEEILRVEAPIQRLFRRATRATEIEGMAIAEGDTVIIQYGGANRDPRKFSCPATVDLDRKDASKHLTFGAGIHFCVGNQLARGELRSALTAITSRCATIELANGADSYAYHMQFVSRSPARMDIKVTAV